MSLIKGCITAVFILGEQQQLKQWILHSWDLNCMKNDTAKYWDLKQMEYWELNLLFLAGFKKLMVPGMLKNLNMNGVFHHARNK